MGSVAKLPKRGLRLARGLGGVLDQNHRRWMSSSSSSNVQGDLKAGEADVAIVGGGIVGLATAREIVTRFPSAKVVVVEKENDIVKHQTSHNRSASDLSLSNHTIKQTMVGNCFYSYGAPMNDTSLMG